jgi:methionyl-tRNA formyltransferase
MRVVFMGTPEFGVPSLRELVNRGFQVIAVVTQPDRPAGRGDLGRVSIGRSVVERGVRRVRAVRRGDVEVRRAARVRRTVGIRSGVRLVRGRVARRAVERVIGEGV